MRIQRHYTKAEQSPYAEIEFRKALSEIRNPDGSVVFRLDDIDVPAQFSQVAADILAQKYFRKAGVPARLKKVEENNVPSFLWRSVPDTEALAALPAPTNIRERILHAAVALLNDEGFASLTQHRVAERAGVPGGCQERERTADRAGPRSVQTRPSPERGRFPRRDGREGGPPRRLRHRRPRGVGRMLPGLTAGCRPGATPAAPRGPPPWRPARAPPARAFGRPSPVSAGGCPTRS